MFYYLTVSYIVPDLELQGNSGFHGPFPDVVERQQALADDLCSRDLETTETVNVTLLKLDASGKFVKECSFIADEGEHPPNS